jgi:hypothetical protein
MDAKITIYDMLGQVKSVIHKNILNGVPVELKADGLASGVYWVSVESNGVKTVKEISVVR